MTVKFHLLLRSNFQISTLDSIPTPKSEYYWPEFWYPSFGVLILLTVDFNTSTLELTKNSVFMAPKFHYWLRTYFQTSTLDSILTPESFSNLDSWLQFDFEAGILLPWILIPQLCSHNLLTFDFDTSTLESTKTSVFMTPKFHYWSNFCTLILDSIVTPESEFYWTEFWYPSFGVVILLTVDFDISIRELTKNLVFLTVKFHYLLRSHFQTWTFDSI